jgi:hypothetical protein
MSRWLEREEKKPASGMETSLSRSGGGHEKRERSIAPASEGTDFGDNRRERLVMRGREYWIRRSEAEALFEVGRFRSVDFEDLVKHLYRGKRELAEADVRSMTKQGLARALSIRGQDGTLRQIVSLTRDGASLLKSSDPRVERENQLVYAGHVKIAELEHDSLLYRAYAVERSRLHAEGASVHRIVLDYELKKELFSKQQRQRGERSYREVQEESARELSLPLVRGHVMLPDLRIEYEDDQGERSRVDIEVATANYRPALIAAKIRAGFRVYGSGLGVQSGGYLKGNVFKDRSTTVFAL